MAATRSAARAAAALTRTAAPVRAFHATPAAARLDTLQVPGASQTRTVSVFPGHGCVRETRQHPRHHTSAWRR